MKYDKTISKFLYEKILYENKSNMILLKCLFFSPSILYIYYTNINRIFRHFTQSIGFTMKNNSTTGL